MSDEPDDLTRTVWEAHAVPYGTPGDNGSSAGHEWHEDEERRRSETDAEGDESWRRLDLTAALAGTLEPVLPTVFRRDDGSHLFYRARVNFVWGDSGEGKSMVVAACAAQELLADHHVVWIDFEDNETVIVERLRLLGATDDSIATRFHYYRPTSPFDEAAVAEITAACAEHTVVLVVVDSLGEAFGLEGIDEDRDVQVGPWLRHVARTLADTGPAVVFIDHSTKAKDNPLFPSGSKRKRAAITGAAYLVTAVIPLIHGEGGKLALTCAKDRHGIYRRGDRVATFDLAYYPDRGASVKIWPTTPAAADGDGDDHAALADQIVAAITKILDHDGPPGPTRNKIEDQLRAEGTRFDSKLLSPTLIRLELAERILRVPRSGGGHFHTFPPTEPSEPITP